MSHSIIPPSSADIWGKPDGCTGWVLMAQQFPEVEGEEDEDALIGEASHEVGAKLIAGFAAMSTSINREAFVGKPASNGIIVTDEMFEGAQLYADDAGMIMRKYGVFGGPNLGIEQRVEMPEVHVLSFGTPDLWIYIPAFNLLFLYDYKFGRVTVEAFENWQMTNYFPGVLSKLGINGAMDQELDVRFRIVQPRAFHRDGPIREWRVKGSDLRANVNILSHNAHKALSNDAELRTGAHCRFCQARHACGPFLSCGMALYEAAAKPIPTELSTEALGFQLKLITRARKQLENLETSFTTQVRARFKDGLNVPHWALEPTFGHRKWTQPVKEVIAMGDAFGEDLRKPEEVITPTQAITRGINEEVVKGYSTKSRTGLKLVPDTGNAAKQAFG